MKRYIKADLEQMSRAISKLTKLKDDDEDIGEYLTTVEQRWNHLYCIIDKDSDDISEALEDTLHRLIDSGANDNEIYDIMGVYIPISDEEWDYIEDDGYTIIDMDYILPGEILSFKKIDIGTRNVETVI